KDLLYRCYNTFYNLNNMVIAIAGNFDVDKTLEICDELLKPSEDHGLQVIVPDEPITVHEKRKVQKLSCAIPLFNIGWKFPSYSGKEQYRNFIVYNILMELCLGNTSDFYNRMYESGLLNDSFSVSVFCGRGYFSVIAEGESVDPDKVLSEMVKELGRLKADGLDEEEFITIRNKTYGELVAGLNNVESVANSMLSQEINGVGIYDGIEITANTTFEDVKAALANMDIENNSLSIIEPV
ncbi:MAG: insulinase family protein, partial [Ruminiclostridium sp.]|nr:insulinase family protein [Ruminiclostridium sp.]